MKNPKIRRFEYQPRFYKPEDQEDEDGPRIKFRRITERKTLQKRSPIGLIILILILIFLFRYLYNINKAEKENAPIKEIKIEVIE